MHELCRAEYAALSRLSLLCDSRHKCRTRIISVNYGVNAVAIVLVIKYVCATTAKSVNILCRIVTVFAHWPRPHPPIALCGLCVAAYRFMQNEVSIGIDRVIILLRLQFKLNNVTD